MGLKINVQARTNYGEVDSLYARIDHYNINRMLGFLECGVSYFTSKEEADKFKLTTHKGRNPYTMDTSVEEFTIINIEELEIKVDDEWQKNVLPSVFSSLLNEETVEIKNIKTKALVQAMIPEISFDDEGNQIITEQLKNITEYIDKQVEVKSFKISYDKVDSNLPGYSYEVLERLVSELLPEIKLEKI